MTNKDLAKDFYRQYRNLPKDQFIEMLEKLLDKVSNENSKP